MYVIRQMTITERSLVETQIESLRAYKPFILNSIIPGLVAGAVVFTLLTAISYVALRTIFSNTVLTPVVLCVVVSIIVAWLVALSGIRDKRREVANVQRQVGEIELDLQAGVVEFLSIDDAEIVEIVSNSTDGPSYCVRIDEGHFLVLRGGHDLAAASDGEWPNSAFEIVRLPVSKVSVSFRAIGHLVAPMATFGPELDGYNFQSGTVVEKPWLVVVAGGQRI